MQIYDDNAKVLINSLEYLKLKELADTNENIIDARVEARAAEMLRYSTTARLNVNINTNGDSWRSDADKLEVEIYTCSNKPDIMPVVGRISQEIKRAINHTLEGNVKDRLARKQASMLGVLNLRLWVCLVLSIIANVLLILL